MSDFKAEVVSIRTVTKHPKADRLDLLTFNEYDWVVIAGREVPTEPRYKVGDQVIYIPIDSVLAPKLESYLFPPDSKIKLHNSRVRTIKMRECISQGMAIDLSPELLALYPKLKTAKLGDDVTAILDISKYEPPAPGYQKGMQPTSRKRVNLHFKEYTDISNFKYYPDMFEGKHVYISEKLHGTSARYGKLPTTPCTLWQKALKFFNLLPKYEFVFGSRRVQLQNKPKSYKGFYDENVYAKIAKQYGLDAILEVDEVIYGEIVGSGLQAGYDYGYSSGKHAFFVYDVMVGGRFLPYKEMDEFCMLRGLPVVPFLYAGPWNREVAEAHRSGPSMLAKTPVREGIVVKDLHEETNLFIGRSVLKWINDDYLLNPNNTDNH